MKIDEIMILNYVPDGSLLLGLLIMMGVDLAFGVAKSVVLNIVRTSEGFRRTLAKFIQYGGSIIIGMVLLNIKSVSSSYFGQEYSSLFGDFMLYIMIYVEVVSILENMEAMGQSNDFVKYFVRPLRRLITFQMRNLFANEENKNQK